MDDAPNEIAILSGCDPSQRDAITSDAKTLLVVAGAGSGKTRVLTRRIAWRIATEQARPSATLALTFTRKASSELRGRLAALGLPSPVTSGTFHAVALAQLRQRAIERSRPLPVILESKARVLGAVLPEWHHRREGPSRLDRRDLLFSVAGEIEWAKARMVTADRYPVEAARAGRTPVIDLDAVAEGYARYEAERKRRRLLDFDDLLTTLTDVIHHDADFAAAQRWKFAHIYVDEFQDANAAQIRLLDAWTGSTRDLFCVGDARQAIYGWNGADPSAMEHFTTRYPGAAVIELSTNYRSSEALARCAGAALPKSAPVSRAAREEGPIPTVSTFDSDSDEAIGVAESIRAIGRTRQRFGACAVLARTNAQLSLVERALTSAGIPCRNGGADRFLQEPAVRRALELLHSTNDRRQSPSQIFRSWLGDISTDPREIVAAADDRGEDDPWRPVHDDESGSLSALLTIAEEYQELEPVLTPDGFQRYLEQTLEHDLLPATHDAVDLLSFHRAKGLEWPVVFVIGLEDGFVPIHHAKTRAALAEEQRLLYVALSRSSDELHCSWSKSRAFGKKRIGRDPSRYLGPIIEELALLSQEQRVDPDAARRAVAEGRALLNTQRART